MKRAFRPERKTVIFFDLNDTLVDSARTFEAGFLALIREYTDRWHDSGEDPVQPELLLSRYRTEWSKRSRTKRKSPSREARQHASLRAALQGTPLPIPDRAIQQFFRELKRQRSRYAVLFPHVSSVLTDLSKHYRLAVITNGNKDATESLLKRHGLQSQLPAPHIFASQQIGSSKPSPLLFRHALNAMHVRPSHAVMVGNSWSHDIFGATRSGMDAVWLNPNHPKKNSQRRVGKEKVYIIRSFQQVRALFLGDA